MTMSPEEKEKRAEERRIQKFNETHKIINGEDYKFCNLHYKYFPDEKPYFPATTEYFYVNNTSRVDGLYPYCNKCSSQKAIDRYYTDPVHHAELHKKYEGSSKHRKWAARNNNKMKTYQSQWRKDNPDKVKDSCIQHRDHDITKAEEQAMLKVFSYSCAYCGMTLEEHKNKFNEKLHNDHVDDEGYNDLRNDVPACKACNTSKHTENMEEWYKKQEFFSEEKLNKIIWWITEGYKNYIEEKPPYRIIRKQNEGLTTYHFELWSIDEKRNIINCIATRNKKKDIIRDIENNSINMNKLSCILY